MMFIVEIVYMLAAFTLLSTFYILLQPFIRAMIRGMVVQSILIGLISFIMAYYLDSIDFVFLGILVIVLRGFLVSYLLERHILKRKPLARERTYGIPSTILTAIAIAIVGSFVVYFYVFYNLIVNVMIGTNSILLFAFMMMFLGIYLILSRKNTMTQIIGYVEEENSMVLMSIFLIPVPFIVEVTAFLDVITLVLIASVVAKEKLEHVELQELRG